MNNRTIHRLTFWAIVCFCAIQLASEASAQVLTGSIEGSIKDEQGAVIAGARVTATQTETNLTRRIESNESGFFRFEQLPIGPYRVTALKEGFKQTSAEAQITLGSPVTFNLMLTVGATNEVVSISAQAAAIELSSSEVSRNVSDRAIQELPVLSRNPADLIQLYPGVPVITEDKNGALTVGGLRPRSTIYNVDGSSNNFQISSGPRTPIIPEAVQEVRALTNVFSAQYGKGAFGYPYFPKATEGMLGKVVQVIKEGEARGLRMWHGNEKIGLWVIEDLEDGGLQFDHGESGVGLLHAYALTADKRYLDAARRVGEWAMPRLIGGRRTLT